MFRLPNLPDKRQLVACRPQGILRRPVKAFEIAGDAQSRLNLTKALQKVLKWVGLPNPSLQEFNELGPRTDILEKSEEEILGQSHFPEESDASSLGCLGPGSREGGTGFYALDFMLMIQGTS